jgi:hypothetical protein
MTVPATARVAGGARQSRLSTDTQTHSLRLISACMPAFYCLHRRRSVPTALSPWFALLRVVPGPPIEKGPLPHLYGQGASSSTRRRGRAAAGASGGGPVAGSEFRFLKTKSARAPWALPTKTQLVGDVGELLVAGDEDVDVAGLTSGRRRRSGLACRRTCRRCRAVLGEVHTLGPAVPGISHFVERNDGEGLVLLEVGLLHSLQSW